MKNIVNNKSWFSLIEILVWIFIFSMWLVSVYAVIVSTMKLNEYNRDYIIATALAGEQLELIRNYRDSNYSKFQKYNQINPPIADYSNVFLTWSYYKIENDYSSAAAFSIKLEWISDFWDWESEVTWKMLAYKLCIDWENRYTYDCLDISWNIKTNFFKYIFIDDVKYSSWWWAVEVIDNAIKVTSKVIRYHRGYHEFETSIILTDFNRL